MQQCEHDGVRLFSDAPVVGSFELNGRTVLTLCRRNLDDVIRDMKLLVRIVPRNADRIQPHIQMPKSTTALQNTTTA